MWQALETKARFIGQVMTGDNTSRRAEDIGGQELSFAEVKAIASGNPSVLTLAEADAELQRLAILRKNHLDEQYVARLRVKELPQTIEHLSERITDLHADRQTVQERSDSGIQITKHWMPREDLLEALDKRLELLPSKVGDSRTISLGNYKGLEFGVILHPDGNPDAYLKGQATRCLRLHAPKFGPRALINALSRLEETLTSDLERLSRDLSVSQSQLNDYSSRLNLPFIHEHYQNTLTSLRDSLKDRLTSGRQAIEGEPTETQLAEQIKSMLSEAKVDNTHSRSARTASQSAEPITARILRQTATTSPNNLENGAHLQSTQHLFATP